MGLAVEIGRIGGMGERGCSRVDREYRKCGRRATRLKPENLDKGDRPVGLP